MQYHILRNMIISFPHILLVIFFTKNIISDKIVFLTIKGSCLQVVLIVSLKYLLHKIFFLNYLNDRMVILIGQYG